MRQSITLFLVCFSIAITGCKNTSPKSNTNALVNGRQYFGLIPSDNKASAHTRYALVKCSDQESFLKATQTFSTGTNPNLEYIEGCKIFAKAISTKKLKEVSDSVNFYIKAHKVKSYVVGGLAGTAVALLLAAGSLNPVTGPTVVALLTTSAVAAGGGGITGYIAYWFSKREAKIDEASPVRGELFNTDPKKRTKVDQITFFKAQKIMTCLLEDGQNRKANDCIK